MITHVHPSSEDRTEARKFGLCWHPTTVEATWACFDGLSDAPAPVVVVPSQQTAPASGGREVQVTFREYDVAQELFRTGGTNTQIAKKLYLCEDTVKSHMKKLLLRTGFATRTELIVAHFRGRLNLVAKPMVGSRPPRKPILEDAL